MTPVRQRITAHPGRRDGHSADGLPGDCLRAAVASLLDEPYEAVPHFAVYLDWWGAMRRYARALGGDFACVAVRDGGVRYAFSDDPPPVAIGSGPSPRGPWWHVALVDADLGLVHDPHPSGAGLTAVEMIFIFSPPYEPPPAQLELCAGGTQGKDGASA